MPEKMNAIKLLEDDHKKVKKLFKDFEGMSDRATSRKEELCREITMELQIHTEIEEQIFYPAVEEIDEELIAEAREEHHVVDLLLEEIGRMEAGSEEFDAKMTVLQENVEHHIEEEEGELFPKVEKKMKDELDALGQRMMEMKTRLMQEKRAA